MVLSVSFYYSSFFFCSLNKYELQGSDLPSVLIPNTSPELWHHILITWICSHLFPASCLINLILFQCSAFITQPSQVSANTRAHMHPAPSPPSNSCKGIYCTNILWVKSTAIFLFYFLYHQTVMITGTLWWCHNCICFRTWPSSVGLYLIHSTWN